MSNLFKEIGTHLSAFFNILLAQDAADTDLKNALQGWKMAIFSVLATAIIVILYLIIF